jgi:hypothetical protein
LSATSPINLEYSARRFRLLPLVECVDEVNRRERDIDARIGCAEIQRVLHYAKALIKREPARPGVARESGLLFGRRFQAVPEGGVPRHLVHTFA